VRSLLMGERPVVRPHIIPSVFNGVGGNWQKSREILVSVIEYLVHIGDDVIITQAFKESDMLPKGGSRKSAEPLYSVATFTW
jgi:hypothetical protein